MAKKCTGTKTIPGCGKTKPLPEFQLTRKWRENVCRECRAAHRREMYYKRKEEKKIMDRIMYGSW